MIPVGLAWSAQACLRLYCVVRRRFKARVEQNMGLVAQMSLLPKGQSPNNELLSRSRPADGTYFDLQYPNYELHPKGCAIISGL